MKKFLSMILALAMVFSLAVPAMAAEDTRTIYFENTDNWSTVNAYAWIAESIDLLGTWPGTAMTKVEGEENIYSIEVPTDGVNMIFNNGSEQTADLTIPTDSKNMYSFGSNSWSTYGSTGGITGGTSSDVTATFVPEIYLSGIGAIGDTVTYDPETNTYIIVFPVGAESITYHTVFSGKNLAYYRDAAGKVRLRETTYRDGTVAQEREFEMSGYNYFSYDEATGNLTIEATPANTAVGLTSVYEYSNDGGSTWQEPCTRVFVQAYSITNSTAADANGSVTVPASAIEGETVELFVTAAEGYELDTLTVTNTATGAAVTVNEDHTFTMPAGNVTVTATFKAAQTAYSITINESENGTVVAKVGEQQVTSAHHNDDVTLVVTAAEGYQLSSLTVKDASNNDVTVTDSNTFVMPESKVTVTAVFEALTAEITGMSIIIDGVEYNSANTSETNPAVITPNTQSLTLKVTGTNLQYNEHAIVSYAPSKNADTVHAHNEWIVNEDGTSATKDISAFLEVLSSTTSVWELQYANDGDTLESSGVYVIYQVPTYAVNISAAIAGGTVTASPNPAEEGQTVTVTVEPVAGYAYVVGSLKVINEATGLEVPVDEASKTFTMPDSTVMVSAEFEELTVTSADISWGSLAFTYSDETNAWSNDGSEKAGTVTVENTGNTTVTVNVSYSQETGYEEITGAFDIGGTLLDSEKSMTYTLTLSGQPKKALYGEKIGTVTVKIESAAAAE